MEFIKKNSWLKKREVSLYLCLVSVLCADPVYAVHDVILFDREASWILEEFDWHDRDALRQPRNEDSPFSYRQQLSFAQSGEGFEGNSTADYSNVQYLEASYEFTILLHLSEDREIHTSAEFYLENYEDEDSNRAFELESLYFLTTLGNSNASIGIGRQEVEDDRAWLIDTHLDGLSLVWQGKRAAFTGVVGTNGLLEGWFNSDDEDADLHHSDAADNDLIIYTRAYVSFGESTQGSVYLTHLRDAETLDEKTWYGLRSLGDLTDNIYYWADFAWLSGTEDSRKIRAWGMDTGFYHTLHESDSETTFTFSYAAGSGDDGIGVDSSFRQTGLQSNAFYGDVLNPELNNLQIASAGLGLRPNELLEIELFYHSYWQINPSTELSVGGVDVFPDGADHFIGQELDLGFSIGNSEHWSLSFSYGRFWGTNNVDADVGSFELVWNF